MKKELVLEGLDCANCAAKIEKEVSNISFVDSVNMNFITKTLSFETDKTENVALAVDQIKKIVGSHEPDVIVREKTGKMALEDDEEKNHNKKLIIRLITGAVIYASALILKLSLPLEIILFAAGYILIGGDVVIRAVKNILKGQVFDENFLMTVATIGAFSIRQYPEAVAVMLFYQIGEFFQDLAVHRSRKSIAALMDIRPEFAYIKYNDEVKKISPEEVRIDDILLVKPGEKIPVDSIVVEGRSLVDTSALTGESVPREVDAGNDVLSGTINLNGVLTIRAKKEYGESAVSKILDLVQNAAGRKAATENFITKFARYYTPAVVFTALLLAVVPPIIIEGAEFSQWIYRALSFLVVSCPCALVISIPLGFFGGIGGASKNGILIKGSNYLEALYNVDTVVFDKTGTLTKGVFNVTQVKPSKSISEEKLLSYAAIGESYSNHPIAVSIIKAYGKEPDKELVDSYDEIAGFGTRIKTNGIEILTGNAKLMSNEGINAEMPQAAGTVVHVAVDRKYMGYIIISDEIKEDSEKAIRELKKAGIKKTVMLTGDNREVAQKIGKELNIDFIYSELLPDQKVQKLEELENQQQKGKKIMFVGDGINDAPVLARADIGTAMGGLGSDAAIEAADIVIMTDEPSKLITGFKIAKKTRRIVWENIIFALGVKVIVLVLVAFGLSTMWEAVFADVGVALIAVLNAVRAMRV